MPCSSIAEIRNGHKVELKKDIAKVKAKGVPFFYYKSFPLESAKKGPVLLVGKMVAELKEELKTAKIAPSVMGLCARADEKIQFQVIAGKKDVTPLKQAMKSATCDEDAEIIDEIGGDKGDQGEVMEAFIQKKALEQQALQHWNDNRKPHPEREKLNERAVLDDEEHESAPHLANAETARNQGLVHLIDYTVARPSRGLEGLRIGKKEVTAKQKESLQKTDKSPATFEDLKTTFSKEEFDALVKAGVLVAQVDEAGRPVGMSEEEQEEWDENLLLAATAEESLEKYTKLVGRKKGGKLQALKQKKETPNMDTVLSEAKSEALAELGLKESDITQFEKTVNDFSDLQGASISYTLGREESKAGRMKTMRIDQGDEILEGTQRILDAIEDTKSHAPDTSSTHQVTSGGGKKFPGKVKDKDGHWVDGEVEAQDTISGDYRTPEGTIKTWGIGDTPEDERISTVMPKN